jgi:hypothetical protein
MQADDANLPGTRSTEGGAEHSSLRPRKWPPMALIRRAVIDVVGVISFLLMIVLCAMWVRSYWASDSFVRHYGRALMRLESVRANTRQSSQRGVLCDSDSHGCAAESSL